MMLLAAAMLAPKVSLAAAVLLGDGYRSAVICTGAGLVRITVSPSGEVLADVSEQWVSPHCTLSDDSSDRLARQWNRCCWPPRLSESVAVMEPMSRLPRTERPGQSGRGPPAR